MREKSSTDLNWNKQNIDRYVCHHFFFSNDWKLNVKGPPNGEKAGKFIFHAKIATIHLNSVILLFFRSARTCFLTTRNTLGKICKDTVGVCTYTENLNLNKVMKTSGNT